MFNHRIVSRRELTLWGAIYLAAMFIGIIALLALPSPAHAGSGLKFVTEKRDYWSTRQSYAAPNTVGTGTHIETVVISIATNYYFWAGRDAPDGQARIAVIGGSVCYTREQGNGAMWQGATVNPNYSDDDTVVNPGPIDVDDDGTSYNCRGWNIAEDNRKWFRMNQSPGWSASWKMRLQLMPDQSGSMHWGSSTTKFFHPDDDPDLNYLFCDCQYG